MPWHKGKSGNPQGRAVDKTWRDALRKAVCEREPATKKQYIQLIAEAVRDAAVKADVACAKEIGDRLDGRAAPSPEETEATRSLIVELVKYRGGE
jgi:hypothetical protein